LLNNNMLHSPQKEGVQKGKGNPQDA